MPTSSVAAQPGRRHRGEEKHPEDVGCGDRSTLHWVRGYRAGQQSDRVGGGKRELTPGSETAAFMKDIIVTAKRYAKVIGSAGETLCHRKPALLDHNRQLAVLIVRGGKRRTNIQKTKPQAS